ncbi:hypothetical protein G3I40_41530 [Streptomyces sp. SID14478]|uniref:hypothetical protein n=1 Tax=Streptomyces sp. SID14478 TaxID=2706073 RepID=UPI0013E02E2A|nr:hypothetical protein [Streptomyces sp. SID14478]NEB81649.1 hypothetical protein [Streptomyces sp. SID14478]
MDEWLATGTGTRRTAATFVHWAVRTHVMAPVDFPWIRSANLDSIGQSERLNVLRRIAEDSSIRLETRVLGLLVLLFAQPVTRISRMSVDDITGEVITVHLTGGEPVPVPHPFDQLFCDYLPQRRHTTTARNNRTRWLFPGAVPGQQWHPRPSTKPSGTATSPSAAGETRPCAISSWRCRRHW